VLAYNYSTSSTAATAVLRAVCCTCDTPHTQRLSASLEEARVSRERCRKLSEDCRTAAEREERLRRQLDHLQKHTLRTAVLQSGGGTGSSSSSSAAVQTKVRR
jgi:hypothetical protein